MNFDHVFDLINPYSSMEDTSCYWGPDCTKCLAFGVQYPCKCDICFKSLTDHEGYADENETWCNLCAEKEEISNGLPVNTRSRCDDTPTNYITCCNCGAEECDYYSYNYKSSVYCNTCALDVCGKLIEKPKKSFKVEPKTFECALCRDNEDWQDRNMVDGDLFCGPCYWHLEIQPKPALFGQYSSEEKIQLARYAEEHNITMEEALDYQTHCHCCGKIVENAVFEENNHQYCGKRCWDTCEEYRYHCFKKGDCKVCQIWHTLCRVEQSMVDGN